MITKPFIVIIACCAFSIIVQTLLPKAMAMRNTPNVDEFMIEDQRTRTRQNYVVQRSLDDVMDTIDSIGPAYVTDAEPVELDTSPEEAPALIVDYANLRRNDFILLDNSVETRTRKRGNVKKGNRQIQDPPCSCKSDKDTKRLGSNFAPQVVDIVNCSTGTCPPPYRCQESFSFIPVLRRRNNSDDKLDFTLPDDLRHKWISCYVNVTTHCTCTRESH